MNWNLPGAIISAVRRGVMTDQEIEQVAVDVMKLDFMAYLEGEGGDAAELCNYNDTDEIVNQAIDNWSEEDTYRALHREMYRLMKQLE